MGDDDDDDASAAEDQEITCPDPAEPLKDTPKAQYHIDRRLGWQVCAMKISDKCCSMCSNFEAKKLFTLCCPATGRECVAKHLTKVLLRIL